MIERDQTVSLVARNKTLHSGTKMFEYLKTSLTKALSSSGVDRDRVMIQHLETPETAT